MLSEPTAFGIFQGWTGIDFAGQRCDGLIKWARVGNIVFERGVRVAC